MKVWTPAITYRAHRSGLSISHPIRSSRTYTYSTLLVTEIVTPNFLRASACTYLKLQLLALKWKAFCAVGGCHCDGGIVRVKYSRIIYFACQWYSMSKETLKPEVWILNIEMLRLTPPPSSCPFETMVSRIFGRVLLIGGARGFSHVYYARVFQ